MKILWMTWKDRSHPLAGGAETVNEELAKRAVADGHEVRFIVAGYKDSQKFEMHKDGYSIVRLGNRWTVYWKVYRHYKRYCKDWADLVIDEVNTVPFFAKFYVKERNILFVHQLSRQIWFYQMVFPLSLLGYLVEPVYLKMLSDRKVITVSESSKRDLIKYGFSKNKVQIISEGITIKPLPKLPDISAKAKKPTILSLGNIRPMKRTMDQIHVFELAKPHLPKLQMIVVGDSNGHYGTKFKKAINKSKYAKDINYYGRVSDEDKIKILKKGHLLLQTSRKEGWGLTVTEAASQGTPAVVYNEDGLRDSVINYETGIIIEPQNKKEMSKAIIELLSQENNYLQIREHAWNFSRTINFNSSYNDFKLALKDKNDY